MFLPHLAEGVDSFVFEDLGFSLSLDERVDQHGPGHSGDGDGHGCGEHGGERTKELARHPFSWSALLSVHQEHPEIKDIHPEICSGLQKELREQYTRVYTHINITQS